MTRFSRRLSGTSPLTIRAATAGPTRIALVKRRRERGGIEHVVACDSVMAFGEAAVEAFARNALTVIVARVAAVGVAPGVATTPSPTPPDRRRAEEKLPGSRADYTIAGTRGETRSR